MKSFREYILLLNEETQPNKFENIDWVELAKESKDIVDYILKHEEEFKKISKYIKIIKSDNIIKSVLKDPNHYIPILKSTPEYSFDMLYHQPRKAKEQIDVLLRKSGKTREIDLKKVERKSNEEIKEIANRFKNLLERRKGVRELAIELTNKIDKLIKTNKDLNRDTISYANTLKSILSFYINNTPIRVKNKAETLKSFKELYTIDFNIRTLEKDVTNKNFNKIKFDYQKAEVLVKNLRSKNQNSEITQGGISSKEEDVKRTSFLKDVFNKESYTQEEVKNAIIKTINATDFIKDDIEFTRKKPTSKDVRVEVKNSSSASAPIKKATKGKIVDIYGIVYSGFYSGNKESTDAIINVLHNKDYEEEIHNTLNRIIKKQINKSEGARRRLKLAITNIRSKLDNIFWITLKDKVDDIYFYLDSSYTGQSAISVRFNIKNLSSHHLLDTSKIKKIEEQLLSFLKELRG